MFFLAYIFIGLTFFVFIVNVTDNLKVLRLVYSIYYKNILFNVGSFVWEFFQWDVFYWVFSG